MTIPSKHLRFAVDQQVGVVTLNRPEARNAITTEMWKALPTVLDTLENSGARVVVITGNGDAFAAGADLVELNDLSNHEEAAAFWTAIEECLNYIWQCDLPVIAMINGACIGGGCLLATSCDLRYAATTATFAIPVARLGIILDDNSLRRLRVIVGEAFAKEMLFTGRTLGAIEAVQRGLVSAAYDASLLEHEVMRTAQSIVHNDSAAVADVKRALHRIRFSQPADDNRRQTIIDSYLSSELRKRVGGVLNALQHESQ